MDSILDTIKRLLGLDSDYEHFDPDIIIGINTAFSVLTQIGVGPEEGFSISDNSATWSDFIGDAKNLEMVKTYVHLQTKMTFDPPTTGPMSDAINRRISELEWRLSVANKGGN